MSEPVVVEEYFNSLQAFKLRNAAEYLMMEEEALKEDLIFNQDMIEKGYIALEAEGEAQSENDNDAEAKKHESAADKARRKAEKQEKKKKKKEKGIGNRIGRFIQSIIDWISNLFGNYEKNTKESIKKKEKWVKENLDKIKNVDAKFWDDYFIDFEPYYGTKAGPIQEKFKNNIFVELSLKKVNADGTGDTKRIDEGFEDDKKMLEWASDKLYNFNKEEPNAIEATKAHYRGREAVKEGNVRYKGEAFKTVMLSMAAFVKEYGKIAKAISKELKNMERVCDDIAKKAEGPKQINTSESFYGIDKYDSLLYSVIEEDYLWNIPRYKKIVENSHIILEDAAGTPIKNEEGGSGGTPQANPDSNNNNEEEQREEQKTQGKDESKAFTNRMKYVKLIISIMTARMTVAEECYNKSFNCLRKVLTMAHDNKFLKEPITDAEKPEKKTEETPENPPKKQEEGTAEPPKGEGTGENKQ